mmetsp:Transcript_13848/g.35333  ORF Transcript_13848/g.35333 Transcript_13848/m.35333 type:complete len:369 (-) Transcript_13848:195-1301(-)|eukprot:CAMPEP_0177656662 /NCGR_PEP_ID=MMETSP0447-20121125/15707_1 /TAXON_ID=0 /ORGANISM="Stygamoeba regulata, Strain BSH-02190019" /LENGTH=368 /DNA_ID=CAMNT_0019160837 /DNA_START=125 /DNA_END=1231 /DNA_ORIENTATION=-
MESHTHSDKHVRRVYTLVILVLFFVVLLLSAAVVVLSIVLYNSETNCRSSDEKAASSCVDVDMMCAYSCGHLCYGKHPSCYGSCYQRCSALQVAHPDAASVAAQSPARLLAPSSIHHVGLTVMDLEKSVQFYTEVLGGVVVPNARIHGAYGERLQSILFEKEMRDVRSLKTSPEELWIANVTDRADHTLHAVFLSFGSVMLELVQFRCSHTGQGHDFRHVRTAPSVQNSMHLAFEVAMDVGMDVFLARLEAAAAAKGLPVVCNRPNSVWQGDVASSTAEPHRTDAQPSKTFEFSAQDLGGWFVVFCKGPNGEQLEFSQAQGAARAAFIGGLAQFMATKAGEVSSSAEARSSTQTHAWSTPGHVLRNAM